MDARHFDHLTKVLALPEARRGVLGLLATLPLLGGLVSLFGEEDAEAKGRRKRRRKRHKHGQGRHKSKRKKPKKCKAKSRAKTCAGKCGTVKNSCKKKINCGSCACDPPCPVCQLCDEATRTCIPDPNQQGDACGDGQICQSDGICACSGSSCGACRTCEDDGACAGCSGCCDGDQCVTACPSCQVCNSGTCLACPDCCDGSGTCQPGDTNAACGTTGETCAICTGQEQCQRQECVCVPDCAGKICGPDGCGEQCEPGCPPLATCRVDGTSCDCDFVPCASTCCADGESCCGTGCANLQSDPNHCGACPIACGPGQVCQGGVCGVVCGDDFCPAATEICDAGSCQPCDVCATCSHSTVQAAIDDASSGETIRICAGSYGRITLAKSLTLIGAGEGSNAASNTILDAAGNGSVVDVNSGATVSLRNLRITGGNTVVAGSGIYNRGNLTLTACTVAQNTSDTFGGGIFNEEPGTIALIDSTVTENTASFGGGIHQSSTGALTLDNTVVSLNTAISGGGIRVRSNGTVTFDGSGEVTGNTASNAGGGIFNDQGTVTLNGTPVTGNTPNNCAGDPVAGCSG